MSSVLMYVFLVTEAMQLMKEGDTWELYIPEKLGYGPRGSGSRIPGGSTLVFTLQMIKVKESAPW